jgi:hypothetical protein
MYRENEQDHVIIGNHVLVLASKEDRAYKNPKNLHILQESYDPIRIKLRVIPTSRAPEPKGMNADYYFRIAGKKC